MGPVDKQIRIRRRLRKEIHKRKNQYFKRRLEQNEIRRSRYRKRLPQFNQSQQIVRHDPTRQYRSIIPPVIPQRYIQSHSGQLGG